MSKYKDLCDIYRESRNRNFDFEKEYLEFAEKLIGNMGEKTDAAPDRFSFEM